MRALCTIAIILPFTLVPQLGAQSESHSTKELRFGVQVASMEGSNSYLGSVGSSTGSLRAAELLARVENIGIVLRTQTINLKEGQVTVGGYGLKEARLLVGGTAFTVEAGVLQRSQPRDADRKALTAWRGGIRSQIDLGGSGLTMSLNAGVQFAKSSSGLAATTLRYRGHDGEALLIYRLPQHIPMYAAIGWRLLTVNDSYETKAESFTQSGPLFAVGLRLGR